MGKSIEVAKALLEEMNSNNCHWSSEQATPKRSCGRYNVDALTVVASRVDALAQRLDRVGTPPIEAVLQVHQWSLCFLQDLWYAGSHIC